MGQFRGVAAREEMKLRQGVLPKARGLRAPPTVTHPTVLSIDKVQLRRQLTQEPGEPGPRESAIFNAQQSNGKATRPGASMYALKMESITTAIN